MALFRCDVIFFNQIWVSKITGTESAIPEYEKILSDMEIMSVLLSIKNKWLIEISNKNNQISNKALSK